MKKLFYIILISTIAISCSSSINSLNENSLHGRWEYFNRQAFEVNISPSLELLVDSVTDFLWDNDKVRFCVHNLKSNGDTGIIRYSWCVNDFPPAQTKEQHKYRIRNMDGFRLNYSSSIGDWETVFSQNNHVFNFSTSDGINRAYIENNSNFDYEYRVLNEGGSKYLQFYNGMIWQEIYDHSAGSATDGDQSRAIESFRDKDKLVYPDYSAFEGYVYSLYDPDSDSRQYLNGSYQSNLLIEVELRFKD